MIVMILNGQTWGQKDPKMGMFRFCPRKAQPKQHTHTSLNLEGVKYIKLLLCLFLLRNLELLLFVTDRMWSSLRSRNRRSF